MKKHRSILIPVMLTAGVFMLGVLSGCTGESDAGITGENAGRTAQAINLFPKELISYDNTDKLSLDDAFAQSRQVIRTAYIKQIDNSNTRSATPFYIYEVDEGRFEKPADKHKNKFPVIFLSRQALFKGKVLEDSVYLFLEPLRQYRILQKNTGIRYEWVDNAPFLIH